MAGKKYCNRCGHPMWYDETAKRWYCTNKKCVKYKEQPKEEPVEEVVEQPKQETTEQPKQEETPVVEPTEPVQETTAAEEPKQDSATDTNVGGK